ncbi:MAG: TOBE domain-containing protein [Candidatus Hydrothermarchaeota archaeon]
MSDKLRPRTKLWLSSDHTSIMGEGIASLLEAIEKTGSLSKSAKSLNISYRHAWGYLSKLEKKLGVPIVKTYRGGAHGGGGTVLTDFGKALLKEYRKYRIYLDRILEDEHYWEACGLKLSARNRLKGTVKDVKKEDVTASVKIEIKTPAIITAIITREAIEELGIKPGDKVEAIIKATEVLIGKE